VFPSTNIVFHTAEAKPIMNQLSDCFSVTDIPVAQSNDNLDKNIENLAVANKSFEIMNILKKINNTYLSKKEFNEEKLNTFTGILYDMVNKMMNKMAYDETIIPYIFYLYKLVFQKQSKASDHDKTKNPKQKSQGDGDNKGYRNPILIQKNYVFLINFFNVALSLITPEENAQVPVKVIIHSLSFIHKFIDEGIPITYQGNKRMVSELN